MSNIILDEPENKSKYGLDRNIIYLVARILFIILIVFTLYQRIFVLQNLDNSSAEYDSLEWFRVLMDLGFLYYISKHIVAELDNNGVRPVFKDEVIRGVLILLGLKIVGYGYSLSRVEFYSAFYLTFTGLYFIIVILNFSREYNLVKWSVENKKL